MSYHPVYPIYKSFFFLLHVNISEPTLTEEMQKHVVIYLLVEVQALQFRDFWNSPGHISFRIGENWTLSSFMWKTIPAVLHILTPIGHSNNWASTLGILTIGNSENTIIL